MARLLFPSHFGVVALSLLYVNLAGQVQAFGLDQGLIHRVDSDESVNRTYFTLRVSFLAGVLLLIIGAAPLLGRAYPEMPQLRWIVIALGGAAAIESLSSIQETFLSKELRFKQLAVVDVAASVVMTLVGPLLAYAGAGPWALVAEQSSGVATRFGMSWLVFRSWSPRFGWERSTATWFWKFGKPNWAAANLRILMDRFDDFWVGTSLGGQSLGFYSRSYEFARYTRRAVANPLVTVFVPIFARLQQDRAALSRAFYRVAYLIVRVGFLISGAFALVMPEFIELAIGQKWRPMLLTFRLMLVYCLVDSLIVLGEGLLVALGRTRQVRTVNLIQALTLVPGVIVGAEVAGIEGVAVAADLMLVVGLLVILNYLKQSIDFSFFKLFALPLLILLLAWGAVSFIDQSWRPGLLATGIFKLMSFGGVFAGLLAAFEFRNLLIGVKWAWGHLRDSDVS